MTAKVRFYFDVANKMVGNFIYGWIYFIFSVLRVFFFLGFGSGSSL